MAVKNDVGRGRHPFDIVGSSITCRTLDRVSRNEECEFRPRTVHVSSVRISEPHWMGIIWEGRKERVKSSPILSWQWWCHFRLSLYLCLSLSLSLSLTERTIYHLQTIENRKRDMARGCSRWHKHHLRKSAVCKAGEAESRDHDHLLEVDIEGLSHVVSLILFFSYFFYAQVQTPVALCSGEWWSILVARLANASLSSCKQKQKVEWKNRRFAVQYMYCCGTV